MNSEGQKFVNYRLYCPKCKSYSVPQDEEPCNECLTYPVNDNSEKPINYKEKEANNGQNEEV